MCRQPKAEEQFTPKCDQTNLCKLEQSEQTTTNHMRQRKLSRTNNVERVRTRATASDNNKQTTHKRPSGDEEIFILSSSSSRMRLRGRAHPQPTRMRGRGGRGFVVLSQPESPNLLASCSWLRNSGSQLRLRQRIVGAPCLGDARLLHVSTISQREAIHLVDADTRATSTFATLHFDRLPSWRRANLDRLSCSDWNNRGLWQG